MNLLCVCFLVLSPATNLHYLKGFAGRVEAWRSFAELETFFSHSGHQNNIASKTQSNIQSNEIILHSTSEEQWKCG